MPYFAMFFAKCRGFYVFYKNILFLISIYIELYCVNLTQKYLTFASDTKVRVALLLTGSICDRDVIVEICILSR